MKRLLAYSSVSQIGYIAVGLGLGTPLGMVGALFHLVNHSAFKSLLFLNAGAVEYAAGSRDLRHLGGLRHRMPFTANMSLVGSMAIAGIPPLNGFWSKLIIVLACIESGHSWLALAAIVMSLVTLAAVLKIQQRAFYAEHKPGATPATEVPLLMRTAMLLLAVLCVVLALLVLAGLRTPYLITPAVDALHGWAGIAAGSSMGI